MSTHEEKNRDLILIIDGEAGWGGSLMHEFVSAGYTAMRVRAVTQEPVLRVSRMMEGVSGLNMVILDEIIEDSLVVCRQFAEKGIPVILVGRDRSQEIWRKALIEAGAEFYVRKPIHHMELIARVKAILRRYKGRVKSVENSES